MVRVPSSRGDVYEQPRISSATAGGPYQRRTQDLEWGGGVKGCFKRPGYLGDPDYFEIFHWMDVSRCILQRIACSMRIHYSDNDNNMSSRIFPFEYAGRCYGSCQVKKYKNPKKNRK